MNPSVPSDDALRAFAVFAGQLNFTRAATQLGISQPSLHVKIKNLSALLGLRLYVRAGRGLRLTAPGEELARFARGHRARVERFTEELRAGLEAHPVSLAAGEGALLYLLGPALRAFTKTHPQKLRLQVCAGEAAQASLRSGEAEVAVFAGARAPAGLRCVSLLESRPALALWRGHPLANRSRLRLEDLTDIPLVLPPVGGPLRSAIDAQLRALSGSSNEWLAPRVAVEARGWPLALQLVRSRIAPAIVNDIVRLPGGVIGLPLAGLPAVRYWCATLPASELRPLAVELRDLIRAHVGS